VEGYPALRQNMDKLKIKTYEAIFDTARDGVIVSDSRDIIILVNSEAERLFGFMKVELLGQKIDLVIPELLDNKIKLRAADATNLGRGEKGAVKELWTSRKDGSKIAIEIKSDPIKLDNKALFSTVVRDITDRKVAADKIRDSEVRFHGILNNMMEGVQIVSFDYKYLFVNDALVQQSGYTRQELLGHTMMEKYPGIENTEMFNRIKECIQTKQGTVLENEFVFPDGSKKYFELSIQPSSENVFILSQDVTERKRHELQIKNQNKLLKANNKELEQFTYIASHDLQEPLRALVSFSELLKDEFGEQLGAKGNEYVEFILKSSMRMQELVKGLMDYSRIGKAKELTVVDCNILVKEVLSDLSLLIKEKKAEVIVQTLPMIKGHEIELRLLFQNLIDNALKFARKDGVPKLAISAHTRGKNWLFSVRDNGIGIAEKDRQKIFTIFKRLHNRNDFEGTGIGLSHCKKIVEVHGGAIWVDSKPGEGSTFNFTITENIEA